MYSGDVPFALRCVGGGVHSGVIESAYLTLGIGFTTDDYVS